MSTTRAIAHNTFIQLTGKVISTALGLVAFGAMAHYLLPEKFGWYTTAISFLQFVGILTDFGLTPVTAQMLSEGQFNKNELLRNLLGFRFTTAVIFLGIAPFVALLFPYPPEVKMAIAMTTISFLAIALNQVFMGYYQTKLQMHIQMLGEVIGRIILVSGIFLAIAKKADFLTIMWVVILSSVAYTLVLWLFARSQTTTSLGFNWTIWQKIMQKMWPISISIIFNVVYLKGDVVILSVLVPQSVVGVYGAAYRVLDVLTQSAMMIMGLYLPLLALEWARENKEEFKKRLQQSFDAMMLLAVPIMIGTMSLATQILQLIAGKEYVEGGAGKILAILSLAVFGVYLGAIFGHSAVAINRQKQTMWVYISDAVLTLIGYLIFIPRFGIYGAAWMSVFSELYAGFFLFFIIKKYTNHKLHLKTFLKILASGLIMAGTIRLLPNLPVVLLAIIGGMVYGASAFLLKVISKQTILEIIQR